MNLLKNGFIIFLMLVTSMTSAQTKPDTNSSTENVLISKFDQGVHVVAEASNCTIKLKDSLSINFKLYVSHDIGISNYEEQNDLTTEDFEVENIKLSNFNVENEILNKEKYRLVVFKTSILKPKQKGTFVLEGLNLNVTANIPSTENDEFGRFIMEKVNRTIKTNNVVINVI